MLPLAILPPTAEPLRVLCLGAHCDDVEIGCGATLLRLAESVPDMIVRWVVFSGDDTRRGEAAAAAEEFLAGVERREIILHRFRESYFPWDGGAIKAAFEELKSFAPSLVFTHYRGDLHQDHRTVAELTWNAFRNHLILEYEVPKYDGDLGNPSLFVPVSEAHAEHKISAICRHFRSQAHRAWFSAETFSAMLRLRGIGCNASSGYAEAFYLRKAVL